MKEEDRKKHVKFLKEKFQEYYFDRREVRDDMTDDPNKLINYGYLNGLELAIRLFEEKEK